MDEPLNQSLVCNQPPPTAANRRHQPPLASLYPSPAAVRTPASFGARGVRGGGKGEPQGGGSGCRQRLTAARCSPRRTRALHQRTPPWRATSSTASTIRESHPPAPAAGAQLMTAARPCCAGYGRATATTCRWTTTSCGSPGTAASLRAPATSSASRSTRLCAALGCPPPPPLSCAHSVNNCAELYQDGAALEALDPHGRAARRHLFPAVRPPFPHASPAPFCDPPEPCETAQSWNVLCSGPVAQWPSGPVVQ